MLNFLNAHLLPKVNELQIPYVAGYNPSNLISSNSLVKSKGYLADSHVKPPVDVEFEFICSVHIDHIIINAQVGTQKTTGLELFGMTKSKYPISIAKSTFDTDTLVICDSKIYSKTSPPENTGNAEVIFFKSDCKKVIENCKSLKIRILRTKKSVPCIGGIEVWGQVSKYCSKITKETVQKLSNKLSSNQVFATESTTQNDNEEIFRIPEDFKDDLTNEIMSVPMTLPCGKTIDRLTLEKNSESEKLLGRNPSDPFTGLDFNVNRKPVLNVALKTRIDMFLFKNSHVQETFNLKRCVGCSFNSNSDEIQTENSRKKIKVDGEVIVYETKINRVEKRTVKECVNCSNKENLYNFVCKHVYCRTCINLMIDDLKCHLCSKNIEKKDIFKIR